MEKEFSMEIIGEIHTDFSQKFGIPRQSGIVNDLKGTITFKPPYDDPNGVRGLEGFSHIWVIWQFSKSVDKPWSPTVRPPRLGGNTRMGVFATRSPFRPNSIGLSCVKLDKIEYSHKLGPILHISGIDMLDGTPIYDIKPYIPYADSHPEAIGGFAKSSEDYELKVEFPEECLKLVPKEKRGALIGVLKQDPRPSYQEDPERVYGMAFANLEVKFTVKDSLLKVCQIVRNKKNNDI